MSLQMKRNFFEKEGTLFEAGGNKPFLLNDSDTVWVVDSGRVDIFAVKIEDDNAVGPRTHIFRAEKGQALFGMDRNFYDKGVGLLAVGAKNTRIMRLIKSRFKEHAFDSAYTEAVSDMIDQWVSKLFSGVRKVMAPKSFDELEAGKETRVQANRYIRPKAGTLWVKVIEGHFKVMGKDALPLSIDGFFPISSTAWLQSKDQGKLYSLDTLKFILQDHLWSGFEQFHRVIIDIIVQNSREVEDKECRRIKDKAAKDRTIYENVLSRFAGVLENQKAEPGVINVEGDLLFTACCLIGREMGIKFESFPRAVKSVRDSLDSITRASRVHNRQVVLKDDWWKHDNGLILAFMENDQRPVALLPVSPRIYELHDPSTGSITRVNHKIADSLADIAYTFYRSLPDRALTVWDVINIGLHDWKKDMLLVVLMGACGAILALITPIMMGIIFDNVIPEASRSKLAQIALILLTCTIAVSMFEFTKAIAILRLKGKIDPSVEAAVVDRMISLPVPFFRKYNTGDLAGRCMGICAISKLLSDVTLQALMAGVFSFFYFILLFWYNWKLALLATGIAFIGIICTSLSSLLQLRYQRKLNEIEGRISGMVFQFINGIAKFRVSGTEDRAFALWAKEFNEKKRFVYKTRFVGNILESFNSSFPILASMAIFAWVVIKSTETFTTGTFLAFNAAYINFQNALLQMSMALTSILNVIPLYERAKPIFETLPEVDHTRADPGELNGAIEIGHVKFRYDPDGPLILNDVFLQIKSGEFVALVGSSGSGKSTLLRLLLGFEEPESGAIYYDGQDITTINIQEVRRQIGVVLQNGGVMKGDIFKNIVGASDLTIDDAWEAARMAGFDEDIKEMPMGMHTLISAGGHTLSGGQRQRLLIARAVVHKPRILFFDEATSALDNRTQAIVSRSLDNLQTTRVVIAHRLSTIIYADRIIVLDKGSILQSGTYKELINQDGLFADLAKRQIA
jgi:NHLM bacteriocin system ABC transporter ATP-binding protein